MTKKKNILESIKELALRRGIIIPTAKAYGSLAGSYDFGPVGSRLKKKIKTLWRDIFIDENTWEIDGNVILPRDVFEASGHLNHFADHMIQCDNCKSILRADEVIEEQIGTIVGENDVERMEKLFNQQDIKCPVCNNLLDDDLKIRPFNIMFDLDLGPTGKGAGFLRPETAQSIFLNFRYTQMGMKENLPFGIAQIGRAFRNEISPRQFLFRLREFNQMEIEIFGTPEIFSDHPRLDRGLEITFIPKDEENEIEISLGEAVDEGTFPNEYFAYLVENAARFYRKLGIARKDLRFREIPDQDRPFYSDINVDVEINFSIGWKEVEGTAYRTDFDLRRHSEFSNEDFKILHNGQHIIPHVVEASFGIDRSIMAVLEKSFHQKQEDRKWRWFDFPSSIAPFSVAVFPLFDREDLLSKSRKIYSTLRSQSFQSLYMKKGSIGKRYRFADEIGIPYCITVDPSTIEDETATIREIKSKKQIRPTCEDIPSILTKFFKGKASFQDYLEDD